MAPRMRRKRAKLSLAVAPVATNCKDTVNNDDSMDVDAEPVIKLKSCDGSRFTITKSQAYCSKALRMMIESHQPANQEGGVIITPSEYINLSSIDGNILSIIVDWCQRHSGDADEQNSDSIEINLSKSEFHVKLTPTDKTLLSNMDEERLLRLMHAANYLDIRGLLNTICQTIAKRWEGKKVEEIRKMYNIESDFKPEEEYQMLQEIKKLGFDN